jgi:hypothetical protein
VQYFNNTFSIAMSVMLQIVSWLTGRYFSPGPPVSSNNKTDRHDITEILVKVALNTIKGIKQTI